MNLRMRRRLRSFSNFRQGFALFIVILIVSIAGSILTAAFYRVSKVASTSEKLRDIVKAYHAAVSAVKVSIDILGQDNNGFDGVGDDWATPFTYNYEGIVISSSISDECGKINVNRLNESTRLKVLLNLLQELNLDESIAYSLKDWTDKDDEVTESGAERFYYEQFGYKPSNAPFKSIYEILYVKGVDRKVFNTLRKFVTIYGDGRINVNSASKEVLMALDPEMTETAAESIIESRPIKRLEELKDLPGFTPELYFRIKPLLTVSCNYFLVNSSGMFGDSEVTVEAFVDRKRVLEWKVK